MGILDATRVAIKGKCPRCAQKSRAKNMQFQQITPALSMQGMNVLEKPVGGNPNWIRPDPWPVRVAQSARGGKICRARSVDNSAAWTKLKDHKFPLRLCFRIALRDKIQMHRLDKKQSRKVGATALRPPQPSAGEPLLSTHRHVTRTDLASLLRPACLRNTRAAVHCMDQAAHAAGLE